MKIVGAISEIQIISRRRNCSSKGNKNKVLNLKKIDPKFTGKTYGTDFSMSVVGR